MDDQGPRRRALSQAEAKIETYTKNDAEQRLRGIGLLRGDTNWEREGEGWAPGICGLLTQGEASCGIRAHDLPLTKRVHYQLS